MLLDVVLTQLIIEQYLLKLINILFVGEFEVQY